VTFKDHDGATLKTETVNHGSDATAPTDPVRIGYTFTGWDVSFDNITGNLEVNALYEITTYTVTFKDHDGTTLKTETVNHGSDATAPSNPVRIGYTFTGWDVSFNNVTSNLEVKALYEINTYTVTFKDHDGATLKTETVDHGSGATAPTDPDRIGYTFTGWDVSFDNVTSNLEVKALYEIKTYTVRFKDHDGTVLNNETVNHGSGATAPAQPTRIGYTFTGWDVSFNNVTSNLEITALYEINTYTVTFKDHDGATLKTETVDHGSDATTPTDPTRVGYTFTAWDVSFNNVTSNLEVTALYKINRYTITFDTDGGSLIDSITQDYLSVITIPNSPSKTGSIFNGWNQEIPNLMPNENLTIKATWIKVVSQTNGIGDYDIEELLGSIDQNEIKNKDVEIIVSVIEKQSTEVTQSESELVNSFKNKSQTASFIEISITVKEQYKADIHITELTKKVTLTIDVPLNIQGYQNYRVIRIHNGIVEELESNYNKDEKTISFETDRFSTYAILYETPQIGFNWLWVIIPVVIGVVFVGVYLKRDDIKYRFKRTKA
jgi:uncharacterized repeat protein (TIGR02543 family)